MRIRVYFTDTDYAIEREATDENHAMSMMKHITLNGIFSADEDFSYYPPSRIKRIDFFRKSYKEEHEENERSKN
jgi:hypothetical protein